MYEDLLKELLMLTLEQTCFIANVTGCFWLLQLAFDWWFYDRLLLQNTKFLKLLFPELFVIPNWVSLKMEGTDVSMNVDDTFPKS